jgi:hypothetical protein
VNQVQKISHNSHSGRPSSGSIGEALAALRAPQGSLLPRWISQPRWLVLPCQISSLHLFSSLRWISSLRQISSLCQISSLHLFSALRVSSKQSNFFFGSNRNKPKLNLFRLFFGLFCKTNKHFFRFVSVFETTARNRILSKQTEKIFKKRSLLVGPRNLLIFFSVSHRNKPKLSLFRLFFGLLFRETKIFLFRIVSACFNVSDRYRNNRNKQNLWYGELKRLIF